MNGFKFFLTTMTFFFLLWVTLGVYPKSLKSQAAMSGRSQNSFLASSQISRCSRSFRAEKKPSVKEELQLIDDQIRELEEMKRGFEAKALRHEDQALRLQFEERWNLEVRRHLELADENRKKAALLQQEIDRLEDERKRLLDQYGGRDGFEDL